MIINRTLALIAGLSALAGCEQAPQPAPASSATSRAEALARAGPPPPRAFIVCSACHATGEGQHGIGPSLAGVSGKSAGAAAGFNYTPALQQSGLVWDEATLHRFLADPRSTVPGTTMTYAGLHDATGRQEIIDWLKTI
ncbi:hypothetical protein PK98_13305 [Croceibacterium mercuriale]|uniref:Cytochrome c domain-containing protein n=1 Tax=Croceibacterium mercuriale TaxID=1572751 RepID=A0A0B2BZN9_9SPHN|nr:c-type cytochrome [Croceibacterium mercuriale]KHL25156.1 hypothetical protein PK98_13305 [Croceibacterium mercuriale]